MEGIIRGVISEVNIQLETKNSEIKRLEKQLEEKIKELEKESVPEKRITIEKEINILKEQIENQKKELMVFIE